VVESGALPIAAGASLERALHGGEDYELLFTARPDFRPPRAIAGVPITRIGRITRLRSGEPAVMLMTGGVLETLKSQGWEHFS
jgi:thiamine-monophosphate kinase